MHHAAKQLAFKRVDPNVIVRDALWVYQAAHNDAGTAHLAKRPILSNEASDRTAPKPLPTRSSGRGRGQPRVRFRTPHGMAAATPGSLDHSSQVCDCPLREAPRLNPPANSTRPAGLHRESDRRPRFGSLAHVSS